MRSCAGFSRCQPIWSFYVIPERIGVFYGAILLYMFTAISASNVEPAAPMGWWGLAGDGTDLMSRWSVNMFWDRRIDGWRHYVFIVCLVYLKQLNLVIMTPKHKLGQPHSPKTRKNKQTSRRSQCKTLQSDLSRLTVRADETAPLQL